MTGALVVDEFGQAFDEAFEEILITRWRGSARAIGRSDSRVAESGGDYRVRIPAAGADPNEIEVEVSERRLVVRIPSEHGKSQAVFYFSHSVDTALTKASFEADVLEVIVPKSRDRVIKVD